MSLILEALKKSEQQRRLGEAPTLGSPVFAARRRRRLLPWLAAAILLAAVGGWWLWRQDHAVAPEPRVAAVAPDATPATAAVPTPPPAATPSAPPQVVPRTVRPPQRPATPPRTARAGDAAPTTADAERARAAVASERGVPTPAPVVIAPGAADRPGSVAELPVSPLTRGPRQQPTPPTTAGAVGGKAAGAAAGSQAKVAEPPPAVPAARPAAAGNRAPVRSPAYPSVWELPYSMRKDLPPLDLTMHVFAADPSARFVILDGERHVEGDDLGDGLSLLEIREDGLVLAFKGQRFIYPRDGR